MRRVLDVASAGFALAAAGFAAGGIGYVLGTGRWPPLLVASAALSAVLYVALRDGEPTGPFEKGALGVLVDVGVLAWLLLPS